MFYIRKINGNDEFRPVSPYYGTTWYEQRGWMLYSGNLPQSRVTIEGGTMDADNITRGGTITELPELTIDVSDFEAACVQFRETCAQIGNLIGVEDFRGGFEEMETFRQSEVSSTLEGFALAIRWLAADKLATYEGAKLGYDQPSWWYKCWNIEEK